MDFYDYEYINQYNGTRSPTGTVECDMSTAYFMRCLYQRAISVIDIDIPDHWNKQYFLNVLFKNGFIAVINSEKYGVIPQICTLSGYGLYMQPTRVLVNQPLVSFSGDIGDDCELIKLTPDYRGIWDIVEHYAIQLSTCYTSIRMSLENSRLAVLLGAKNKNAKATLEIIAEKISSGESVIIYDKELKNDDMTEDIPIWTLSYNVKDNYITDKLLDNLQMLINQFDREIGIPTVDSKKERMITGEVQNMTADSCARLNTWATCLEESIDKVNALFGLNISFTTKAEEVEANVTYSQIDANRNL